MSLPDKMRMQSLLRELRRGATTEDALQVAFRLATPALEQELATRYASGQRLPTQEWHFAEWEARPANLKPLAPGAVRFHLGDLLTHRVPIQFDLAEEYLLAALAADSSRAEAYASLGQLRHEAERYPESHALYAIAVQFDPNDPHVRLGFGLSLVEECFAAETGLPLSAPATPSLLLQARAELRPLIALDTPSVEDELAFGRTFLLDREGRPRASLRWRWS
jgi:tetratricopeptide (TPR) repeat protein